MNPQQEGKLDALLAGMNQLIPQVADAKQDISGLQDDVGEIKLGAARQDERMNGLNKHLDAVGSKVRTHVENGQIHSLPSGSKPRDHGFKDATARWKFVGAVAAAVIAVAAAVAALAQLVPHH